MLQRFAGRAPRDQLPVALQHGLVDQRHHHQPPARDADDVRGEQLGVDPRAGHARGGEFPLGLEDRDPQRMPGHLTTPPRAARPHKVAGPAHRP